MEIPAIISQKPGPMTQPFTEEQGLMVPDQDVGHGIEVEPLLEIGGIRM